MLDIDHRSLFKVFLLVMLITIGLWLIEWYFDVRSASVWFLLLWIVIPIVLSFLAFSTLLSAILERYRKKERTTVLRYVMYTTIFLITFSYDILIIPLYFMGFS